MNERKDYLTEDWLLKDKNKVKFTKLPNKPLDKKRNTIKKTFAELNVQFKVKNFTSQNYKLDINKMINKEMKNKILIEDLNSDSEESDLNKTKNKQNTYQIKNNFFKSIDKSFIESQKIKNSVKKNSDDSSNSINSQVSEYYIDTKDKPIFIKKKNDQKLLEHEINSNNFISNSINIKEDKNHSQMSFFSNITSFNEIPPKKRFSKIFPISNNLVKKNSDNSSDKKLNFLNNTGSQIFSNEEIKDIKTIDSLRSASVIVNKPAIHRNSIYKYLVDKNPLDIIEENPNNNHKKNTKYKQIINNLKEGFLPNLVKKQNTINPFNSKSNDFNPRVSNYSILNSSHIDFVKLYETKRQSLVLDYLPSNYKQINNFDRYQEKRVNKYHIELSNVEKKFLEKFSENNLNKQINSVYKFPYCDKPNPFFNFRVNDLRNSIVDIYDKIDDLENHRKSVFSKSVKEFSTDLNNLINKSKKHTKSLVETLDFSNLGSTKMKNLNSSFYKESKVQIKNKVDIEEFKKKSEFLNKQLRRSQIEKVYFTNLISRQDVIKNNDVVQSPFVTQDNFNKIIKDLK